MKLSVIIFCLFLSPGIVTNCFSQTIVAAWKTAAGVEEEHPATTTNKNVETAILSRGPGLSYKNTSTYSYVSTFPIGQDKATAKAENVYYQVIIRAKEGHKISLSTLDSRVRRSSSASVRYYRWSYSLNGSDFKEIGNRDILVKSTAKEDTTGENQVTIDLSAIPDLQNIPSSTTITSRMYAWGGKSVSANFGFGKSKFPGNSVNTLSFGGVIK